MTYTPSPGGAPAPSPRRVGSRGPVDQLPVRSGSYEAEPSNSTSAPVTTVTSSPATAIGGAFDCNCGGPGALERAAMPENRKAAPRASWGGRAMGFSLVRAQVVPDNLIPSPRAEPPIRVLVPSEVVQAAGEPHPRPEGLARGQG